MAWIESHNELGEHPKTKRLARLLGESLPTVVGRLHYLWWWAMKYAPDGDLSRFEDADISDGAFWTDDPGTFVSCLIQAGFVDRDDKGTQLHDWYDYAGRLIDRREKNAERKRKSRTGHADVTRLSRGHVEDGHGSHRATLPNQTIPNQTVPKDEEIASLEIHVTRAEAAASVETVKDSSSSSLDPDLAHFAELYEAEGFGQITEIVRDQLVAVLDAFGPQWCQMAVREAVLRNKRNLNYVARILENWRSEGGPRTGSRKQSRGRDAPRELTSVGSEGSTESGQHDPRYSAFYELFPDV